jgi:chromate reductase
MTRILAISGSLRSASNNTALLRAAAALAPEGVDVELFEGLEQIPPYNEDHDNDDVPAEVAGLREEIGAADAVLFSTPEYDGAMPGQLKQVVDWASRPHGQASSVWGKPVAVTGAISTSASNCATLWSNWSSTDTPH